MLQLINSGRTIHVTRHHHDFFLLVLLEPAGQLAHGGGFTRALKTGHENNGWRLLVKRQRHLGFAHQLLELLMNHADEGLTRRQRTDHIGTQGFFLHLRHKILDDR